MIIVAPRSAKLVEARGARFTLLCGYVFLLAAFLWMLFFWTEGISYWQVALAYAFVGIGVGLAGTPASHSLTGSVPVQRAGMASGTADLQRDLGGALLTSIFGALLAAGYAAAMGAAITSSSQGQSVTESTQSQLQLSYASAADLAAAESQVLERDPRRRESRPSWRGTTGRTRRASSRSWSEPRSSSSSSRGRTTRSGCSPSSTPRTRKQRRQPCPLRSRRASAARGGG